MSTIEEELRALLQTGEARVMEMTGEAAPMMHRWDTYRSAQLTFTVRAAMTANEANAILARVRGPVAIRGRFADPAPGVSTSTHTRTTTQPRTVSLNEIQSALGGADVPPATTPAVSAKAEPEREASRWDFIEVDIDEKPKRKRKVKK